MALPIANFGALPTQGIRSYLYQRSTDHKHRGIDLPAPKGTPVLAAAPGRVAFAEREWRQGFTGYGRVVVLEHAGGAHTLYAHLDQVSVRAGQQVQAGQQLGTVGTTRFSKEGGYVDATLAPHLHFEAAPRRYPMPSEAERIDPIEWLRGSEQGQTIAARGAAGPLFAFMLGLAAWVLLVTKKAGRRG